jgi:threonine synthase
LPYGGGGNLCAYAKGFAEIGGRPRLLACEAADRGATVASAIRISEPVHRGEVDALVAEGQAAVVGVGDEQIVEAWLELASGEGIFCEPASAAGLAAVKRVPLGPREVVVCVLTGHGLKDTAAVEVLTAASAVVEPKLESILAAVG